MSAQTRRLPPDWTRAACHGLWEAFFPEHGQNTGQAQAICHRCELRQECLDWAITTGQEFGVWGGTTPEERLAMRKMAA